MCPIFSDFITCHPVLQPSDLRTPTTNKLSLQRPSYLQFRLEGSLLLSSPADSSALNVILLAFLITLYKIEAIHTHYFLSYHLFLCTVLIQNFNDFVY